ncbi:hypothetical protein NDI56_03965 [Haloarcula sp. S1CR25-12]|uniref:Uncharacterized protein n=1 Tax=Haloarcula saliterrae TaxID=2950534 RepID=A0ABU2F8L6_9EURY|nr:hypothetical protein [Haloarcula sp. S1CR25-12]MDS0258566.1 hypothetical protein [Haloarcula sp. S1CR25-12]
MTGAGSGTLVAAGEQSFMGSLVGAPDLFALGRDPTITELSLDNALQRLREYDNAWTEESVKSNFEGAITIEAVVSEDVHTDVEEQLVLNAADTIVPGVSTSGRIFAGVDYPSGTAEEEYFGCIPLEYSVNYQQGDRVRYTLSMAYAKQESDPAADLTTATRVSDGSALAWHGVDLQIDAASVSDLQSATLSMTNLSRFQYGLDSVPNRGVTAAPEATLDVEATFVEETRLDLAKGGESTDVDTLDSVSGTMTLTPASGNVLRTFNLAKLKPDTHSWNEVIGTEDTSDQTTFNVDGDPAVTFA